MKQVGPNQFETDPLEINLEAARSAPSRSFEPSPEVRQKTDELIQKIRSLKQPATESLQVDQTDTKPCSKFERNLDFPNSLVFPRGRVQTDYKTDIE